MLSVPLAGLIAYSTSFAGAFVFDDIVYFSGMTNVKTLSMPWVYFGTATRPIADFSLAVNYAISVSDPWSYHVFNLAVHLAAATTLYGIVRRTLSLPRWTEAVRARAHRFAAAIAAVWVVHPLTTEAVTYVIHRTESMMALFYLLTLYAAIRYFESSTKTRWLWIAVAALALWLGINCKQVIASAPLVVLLYDRTFVSGTAYAAIRRHWALYAAVCVTWLWLLKPLDYGHAVVGGGGGAGIAASKISQADYLASQAGVLIHYLRLCVWPHPLSIDYGWKPVASFGAAVPAGILIVALLAATGWLVWRRHVVGFLGAVVFLVLAPTSSFMPLDDLVAERRMYLPLAAVVALAAIAAWRLLAGHAQRARILAAATGAIVIALATTTIARNLDYRNDVLIWGSALRVNPDNARAHSNIGPALVASGKGDEAVKHYQRALELDPDYVIALNNLGVAYDTAGEYAKAIAQFKLAIAAKPNYAGPRSNLAKAARHMTNWPMAAQAATESLALRPDDPDTLLTLAIALAKLGRIDAAHAQYRKALEVNPEFAEAHAFFGQALARAGNIADGLAHAERAIALAPNSAATHAMYGAVLAAAGRRDDALVQLRRAVELDPNDEISRAGLNKLLEKPR